jgi:small ligand-binding sensory domain FIST
MMRAGVGISTALDPESAGQRASEEALGAAGLRQAECAVVLGAAAHGIALERAVASCAQCLGTENLVGGAVEGLLTRDQFVEGNPGVAVLALGTTPIGVAEEPPREEGRSFGAQGFLLRDLVGAEEQAGEEILAHIGGPASDGDLLLLFADSQGLLARPLLASIGETLAPATVVGLGASPIPGASPLVWGQSEVAGTALAGLMMRGAGPPRVGVANACSPASGELLVTRARGNWVLGLGGRPALDVYREIAGESGGDERSSSARRLMVALAIDGQKGPGAAGCCEGFLDRGAFVVRDIVGSDPERRAFSVPEPMASGRVLAFVRSDPERGRADLESLWAASAWQSAAFGLHFACRTSAALPALQLADVPLIGGVGSYQIGPVAHGQGTPTCELLTHSELLVLLAGGSAPDLRPGGRPSMFGST